ncbi:MAG: glutamyl-tRNA reductase [Acidimicrobiales bacterium]
MSVVVVGLNHRTVPLALLERLAVPESALPKALADLVDRQFVTEAVVLSTCHRVEVYAVAERFHGAMHDIRHFFSERADVDADEFTNHLYAYHDEAAVTHLFGVAAGLDSVVPGESQVLGQVRGAWDQARAAGTVGPRLSPLFRHALEVGKRARSETAIARGITSLSQAAVALATQELGSLAGRCVVVLGTGEMGEGMATDLAGSGNPDAGARAEVVVANRTWPRAVELARRVGGRAVPLEDLPATLGDADVLFTSTGSESVVLAHDDLFSVARARGGRPLLIIDLGLPRDVDPAVGELPGVTLLDLGHVQSFVEANVDGRRKETGRVAGIVESEVERFMGGLSARQAAPTITALRRRAEQLRATELERYRSRLEGLDERQREAVEALTASILAKLLHEPTVRMKDAAGSARGERLTGALRELFDL